MKMFAVPEDYFVDCRNLAYTVIEFAIKNNLSALLEDTQRFLKKTHELCPESHEIYEWNT